MGVYLREKNMILTTLSFPKEYIVYFINGMAPLLEQRLKEKKYYWMILRKVMLIHPQKKRGKIIIISMV